MSLLDKAQAMFQRIRGGSGGNPSGQPSEESMYSRRHDGSLSGYHPNAVRQQPASQEQQPASEPPVETWVQPSYPQESVAIQPVVQPPMAEAYPYQQNYQQNFPQSYQQPYQQQWAQPQEQPQMAYPAYPAYPAQPTQTMAQPGGYNQSFQQPQGSVNTPGSPFVGYNPAGFSQSMQLVPTQTQSQQPVPDNISYLPGHIIGKDGREYSHRVRVAQVTNIADCYPLMECMRNNESVVVNLDKVQDTMEVDRCLDLLYGACYALQCQFNQVSERAVYLLTPGVVDVVHAEELRRQSEYEIDNRWPDPSSLAYRQRASSRDQGAYGSYSQSSYGGYGQDGGYGQGSYSQTDYTPDYQSYGGIGRRTATNRGANDEYSDFGGFPNAGRF